MSDANEEFATQLLVTLDNLGHLIGMAEQHAKEYAQRQIDANMEWTREEFRADRAEMQRMRDYINTQNGHIHKLEQKIQDMELEQKEYTRHLLNERNGNGPSI